MAVARGLVAGRFKSDEAAYLERFGLNDLPFATTPNPAYAYAHPSMLEGLRQMRQVVIERSGLGMVSGEVGLGKTMLSRYVESDLSTRPWARALYFPRVPGGQRQTEASVMREVAHSLGLKRVSGNSSDAYYRAIAEVVEQKDASEGTTVIIIDDAHMLNASGVRALLRLLALQSLKNQFIQVLLFGQNPEMLDAVKSDRALHSRLSNHVELHPFSEEDVAKMVEYRLRVAGREAPLFTSEAINSLAVASRGIPRLICRTASLACVYACDENAKKVNDKHVSRAASQLYHDGQTW